MDKPLALNQMKQNILITKKGKYKVRLNFFDEDDDSNHDEAYMLIGNSDTPVSVASYLINDREERIEEDLCGRGKDGAVVTRADMISFFSPKFHQS